MIHLKSELLILISEMDNFYDNFRKLVVDKTGFLLPVRSKNMFIGYRINFDSSCIISMLRIRKFNPWKLF